SRGYHPAWRWRTPHPRTKMQGSVELVQSLSGFGPAFRYWGTRSIHPARRCSCMTGQKIRIISGGDTMKFKLIAGLCALGLLTGCPAAGTTTQVRDSGSGPSIGEARAADYNGPQARIAVARFENKASNSGRWWNQSIGDGMADMLTTALFNSGRFIVLERQAVDDILAEQDFGASGRVRQDTAAAIGEVEGAELLVVAAVTEFSENASGRSGSFGG